jgi:hypothetical protein
MSIDLAVPSGLTQVGQPIQDQNGTSSSLNIATVIPQGANPSFGAAVVNAAGDAGATAVLGLATAPLGSQGQTAYGNVLIAAVEATAQNLPNQALLVFQFAQGSGTVKSVFTMFPNGVLQASSLPNLPPTGTLAPLVIDSNGVIYAGRFSHA